MKTTVGRSESNDIVINDSSVSKFHALMYVDSDGAMYIEDLKSTNGTFVNGIKINGKQIVNLNDTIYLGKTLLPWQELLLSADSPETMSTTSSQSTPAEKFVKGTSQKMASKKQRLKRLTLSFLAAILIFGAGFHFLFYSNWWIEQISNIGNKSGKWEPRHDPIQYDIECLRDSSIVGTIVGIGRDLKDYTIGSYKKSVPIEQEVEVGLEVKAQMKKDYEFIRDEKYIGRVDSIMTILLAAKDGKEKFSYKWHVLASDEINAFTAGGQIFITTGLIDFSENNDEIACVLGHEIYHNELGHINKRLTELAVARGVFGEELGDIAMLAASIITMSFNQEDEVYCDMYGTDLAVKAGYNGCSSIDFWNRMQEKDQKPNEVVKLFRTHPFSKDRIKCLHHHVEKNYFESCR